MGDLIEIIGLAAGACTTLSAVPQIRKIIVTKSAQDIAYLMCLLNCTGFILWIAYAVLKQSLSLFVANVVTLILWSIILVLKYRWEKT